MFCRWRGLCRGQGQSAYGQSLGAFGLSAFSLHHEDKYFPPQDVFTDANV